MSEDTWPDMIDVNLSGVWRTCKAAIPHLIAGGRGGSMVLTSSAAGPWSQHSRTTWRPSTASSA